MNVASANGIRISPRKVRLVIDLIRGRNVVQALSILENTNKKSTQIVKEVLKSAINNAEQQGTEDVDLLSIQKAFVNSGPTLRRFKPRAFGRATRIRKRTSRITIYVGLE